MSSATLGKHVHESPAPHQLQEWDGYKTFVFPYERERYLPML